MRSKVAKEIEDAATRPPEVPKTHRKLFSTGSTELNLACSNTIDGAFAPGMLVNIIGDSHAGKTYLAHSILAEAALNPAFTDYDFYYDNAEAAETTGIQAMFGKALVDRLKPPIVTEEGRSTTVQQFVKSVWKALDTEKPFIYVIDSLDSLDSDESMKRFEESIEGKEEKGSYKMEKPKYLSENLRKLAGRLLKTQSLLIILSQTRDNINPMSFKPKTRSGGHALEFYSSFEMWLGLVETIKKGKPGHELVIGHTTRVKVTKNKLTGKVRTADFSIYTDYGIDDVGSCVDFLVDEVGFWEKKGNTIQATGLNLEATREKLIREIETQGLEKDLREMVGKAWLDREEKIKLDRKKRYE
jgi:recombination protein RecA